MKLSFSSVAAGAALFVAMGIAAPAEADQPSATWVTSWATALQPIPPLVAPPPLYRAPDVAGRTIRQIVYPTLGGRIAKIHLSNEYGRVPLVIESMGIAPSASGAATNATGAAHVTFGGRPDVSVPPGGELDSDPVAIDLRAGAPYAISSYMGPHQTMTAWHRVSSQLNYVSPPGDHVADASPAAFAQRFTQYAWVTGLAVDAPQASTVAAIGDSITDGMRSSLNRNRRWPDALARRLARAQRTDLAVIDLGISGNRLLSDSPCYGEALERRFERDALRHPGVKTVVLLIGINDINFQAMPARAGLDCDAPHTQVSAEDLIAGYKRVIALAHARGVRILGGTLTPASLPPARETIRQSVNKWIRTSHAFADVVDFDVALRDPVDPVRLRREYDSGDHIHPSDAGYMAMAEAVPLAALNGSR
ncbi:MAG: SGNH/GDSL hydrolase family protein [Paraburkholderia sp.]|uniref:SGNH/GDSL hydrolase family protein n=1 Tax=Paraburkholderia sp. TaxID=1926495 RepID=UPI00120DBBCD|nr:SGNH/GDSL hydrolase family protein [Paraburkholderia sp.]TAM03944.1 MAG: SGNH/GDSL hydrolase family protein [Paraburkholderia sp.]TAM30725.1 MAG: SGNH/GDSL hydrolase family protein [Paraburkholderia sp.]